MAPANLSVSVLRRIMSHGNSANSIRLEDSVKCLCPVWKYWALRSFKDLPPSNAPALEIFEFLQEGFNPSCAVLWFLLLFLPPLLPEKGD